MSEYFCVVRIEVEYAVIECPNKKMIDNKKDKRIIKLNQNNNKKKLLFIQPFPYDQLTILVYFLMRN